LKISCLFLISTLILGAFGFSPLVPKVFAQDIMIETSADDHDNRFFGESVLQVVIIDSDSDDDSVIEEMSVDVEATPQSGSAASQSLQVSETSASSGKFEFFLAHEDASAIGPADLDADNPSGVEGDGSCIIDCALFVTFGPTGDINAESSLYEETRFEITVDDVEITINYEETSGSIELDRESYGSTSFVYISVNDQDANLNPTERDEFTVDPGSDPNSDLLEMNGGTFEDVVVFEETGDNTGIFEGRYRLGVSIDADADALVILLKEKANYDADLDAQENDSNETDAVSFTIGDNDGSVGVGDGEQQVTTFDPTIATDKESYADDETVHVTIADPDANINSSVVDSIETTVSSGSSEIELSLQETSTNSGAFEASFILSSETNATEGTLFAGNSVTITYTDDRPADYSESIDAGENPQRDFELAIDVNISGKTGIETTDVARPIAKNMAGNSGPFSAGTSLTLSTTITNNNSDQEAFVALIEVRDSNDVTVFLSWQSGNLESRGTTNISVAWLSNNAGAYQVRTFVLSSLGNGAEVLSPVATSDITVT
jgi:hypothetical protein